MATEPAERRATLVDSDVLLDVASVDPHWGARSARALEEAADSGPLAINPIIYAEVSVRFTRVEDLEQALPGAVFARLPLPWPAAFLAGKVFISYRRRGGARAAPLPDFYIGAHAAVSRLRLLTRHATRYRTYFPTVELVSP